MCKCVGVCTEKAYAANKEKIHKIQQAEKRLEEIRKQLRLLIPELQKEYQEELNLAVSDMNKVERCAALKQYGVLPKQFWWNIDPSQLREKEMYLTRESFFSKSLITVSVLSREPSLTNRNSNSVFSKEFVCLVNSS